MEHKIFHNAPLSDLSSKILFLNKSRKTDYQNELIFELIWNLILPKGVHCIGLQSGTTKFVTFDYECVFSVFWAFSFFFFFSCICNDTHTHTALSVDTWSDMLPHSALLNAPPPPTAFSVTLLYLFVFFPFFWYSFFVV